MARNVTTLTFADRQQTWHEWGGVIESIRAEQIRGRRKGAISVMRELPERYGGPRLTQSQVERMLREADAGEYGHAGVAPVAQAIRAEAGPAPSRPSVADLVEEFRGDGLAEDVADLLTADEETAELILERAARSRRHIKRKQTQTHRIERQGPFALVHFGDPHLDDDGCDWDELLLALRTVKATEGMHGVNVGDTTNNWVGRLQALYKHQTTTEGEAFQLYHWFAHAIDWDCWVLGNHDHWNQGSILHRYITDGAAIRVSEDHEARIEYTGGAAPVRLLVRHDFAGHSQWNPNHGEGKRAAFRPWADVLVCGHRHNAAYQQKPCQVRDVPVHLVRVAAFKKVDSYAQSRGFAESDLGAHFTTVVNPDAAHPGERVHLFHCVETAADYLAWLRGRA